MFDAGLAGKVEEHLRLLVSDLKGVRRIQACSRPDLEIYRISFGYQRRKPLKNYLLMYDPMEKRVVLCADGAVGYPPPNVQQRLLGRFGRENYEVRAWTYLWTNVNKETITNVTCEKT